MPKLGESVTEGTITAWLVKEGEVINKYDPIAEVMTDKVNAEVPSSYAGTITEIIAKEGEVIAVDELICYIETETESSTTARASMQREVVKQTNIEQQHIETEIEPDQSMRSRYSPAVLTLANEYNLDLTQMKGTGLGGRITRKDVKKQLVTKSTTTTESSASQKDVEVITDQQVNQGDVEIPISGVRKAIANNMTRSKQEIPHAWMTVEADVTGLVQYRDRIKESFKQREGYTLTYFSFFIHAVARALKEFPQINSTWANDKIIQRHDVHISIAVAKESELFVPVIKHADEKSVQGIAKDVTQLANKARNGQLTPEDMQGGTFTVNNTGTFGSISSMGIINHPQAAILQVESIVKRPVIINDMFAARDIVNLSLSLDHRILDGLICGRFLARIKEILESINEDSTIV